jgi:hypothetical protein
MKEVRDATARILDNTTLAHLTAPPPSRTRLKSARKSVSK